MNVKLNFGCTNYNTNNVGFLVLKETALTSVSHSMVEIVTVMIDRKLSTPRALNVRLYFYLYTRKGHGTVFDNRKFKSDVYFYINGGR